MLLREKCTRAGDDPEKSWARLALQHRKLVVENPFYKSFIRIFDLPDRAQWGKNSGPLVGSSFAVKDTMAVSGFPTSLGLQPAALASPTTNASLVSSLQRAGATLFGSANLDELCLSHQGSNSAYGRVVNPLDAERAVLGSSCGSAAAVARGQVDFALGTDFGGSVRLPAASCGLCGFRGSPGFLPRDGVFLLSETLDSCGILSRYIDDLIFLVESLGLKASPTKGRTPPRLYIPSSKELSCLDEETRHCFQALVAGLKAIASVEEVPAELSFQESLEARKILAIGHSAKILERLEATGVALPATAQAVLLFDKDLSMPRRAAALCRAQEAALQIEKLLGEDGILITPTIPLSIPSWQQASKSSAAEVPMNIFLALANLCQMPALSFPTHLKIGEIPFSAQFVTRAGKDYELLVESARIVEKLIRTLG